MECLDRFSEAVLLLDARGRIRVSNRAADALLRQGDALASTRDGVSACDPRAARVLCAALARAAQLGAAPASRSRCRATVLAKTDTRRQAALVRLLRAGLARLRAVPGSGLTTPDSGSP